LSIAEPVNRPSFIHEYKLTATSLYAAVTIGKSTEDIINELARQAKNVLPSETVNFIEKHTQNIGKLELIDSGSDNLTLIVYDHHIAEKMCGNGDLGCRLFDLGLRRLDSDAFYGKDTGSNSEAWKREFDEDSIMRSHQGIARRFILQSSQNCTQICKVLLEYASHQQKLCFFFLITFRSTYSVTNLYDFKSDASVKRVEMNPRSKASLRPYQEECLSKIFGNGRARSGIIVLPCGAGKTLVGVSVASLIQRDTLVLCSSSVAVRQWAEQFQMWTTVKKECVIEFTADIALDEARMHFGVIVITTYSMMRRGITTGKQEANVGAQKLVKHNWGLLILDEVHMAASKGTEEVLRHMTKVRCKVGLTATLVREDAKVQLLDILVGPKLYEAKWMALAENGYIARVRCIEILCPMTSEFYRRYLETTDFRAKMRLWTLNPNKYLACLHVLKLHQERQDKVLIFIDDRVTLHSYGDQLVAQGFSVKTMHGGTPEKEKNEMIKCFKCTQGFAVLLLSRVGDVAIDLPEASVLIEVDGHFGSRRQEAQRLGRILRAKTNAEGSFNASFYVLVSKDTGDTYFAPKRQAYLVDQGYAYNSVCMHGPGEETVSTDCLYSFGCRLANTCTDVGR
jgi:DNA excision repair protein ERCC-3